MKFSIMKNTLKEINQKISDTFKYYQDLLNAKTDDEKKDKVKSFTLTLTSILDKSKEGIFKIYADADLDGWIQLRLSSQMYIMLQTLLSDLKKEMNKASYKALKEVKDKLIANTDFSDLLETPVVQNLIEKKIDDNGIGDILMAIRTLYYINTQVL